MKGYRRQDLVRDTLSLATYAAEEGSRPLVFQHGLCGDAAQPAEMITPGSEFRHHVLECPGHGRSEIGPETDISIAAFADLLVAMMDEHGLLQCPVGGISMGAAMALRLAVLQPKRVSHLILARPAWETRSAPENMRPNAEVGRLLCLHDRETARQAFLETAIFDDLRKNSPENLVSLAGFFDRENQVDTARLLSAISRDGVGVSESQIAALSMPVLVIATDKDLIHPMSHAQKLASMIPNATFREITPKSASRVAHVAEFQAALSAFLKEYS